VFIVISLLCELFFYLANAKEQYTKHQQCHYGSESSKLPYKKQGWKNLGFLKKVLGFLEVFF